ncbi:MAG: acid phosphatase [Candidatus Calescibacterium sp.]|nr:acid phosphatase [Candidatus Calescibacterium sp.]
MNRLFGVFLFLLVWVEICLGGIPEPPNLGILKKTIRNYIESGSYDKDIELVVNKAIHYVYDRYDDVVNPAAVFDIDETALSNIEYEYKYDFGFSYDTWVEWVKQSRAKAIKPTLKLYRICQQFKVQTFFITGRNQLNENLSEDPTVVNLKNEGYFGWKRIYFKPIGSKMTTIEYKSKCRKEIEENGYKIIINIGDQWSDLEGGYSEQIYKLPNPMYYIP